MLPKDPVYVLVPNQQDLTEDEFICRLEAAGWPRDEAKAEWDAIQRGERE